MASGGGAGSASDSSTPEVSSTTSGNNSPTVATQPPTQEPSAQDGATPSTQQDSPPQPVAPAPEPAPTTKPRRATVTYEAGLLSIQANDSSLNLILRQVAHLTGMKITGGVAEERVFGNYGPSKPSTVLSTLLDGTRSDMVLRHDTSNTITELILTPRGGGAVPPGPNALVWGPDDDQSGGK